uniref:Uncharacterized protein n=1 Tax=Arundo donax TaxID=35708 RepID=A0A0A9HJW0_ARUDO
MDIDYVEQWLVQKEQEAIESYFQTYAPGPQRLWHDKWLSSLQDYSQSALVSRCDRIWRDSDCSDLPSSGLSRLLGRIESEQDRVCSVSDLMKANCKAMHSLREFLSQSLLEPELELEVLAMKIIGAAANNCRNLFMIGARFKLIGPLLIKSLIGSPDTQVLALNLIARLSRIHSNKVIILNLGGFSFATHLLKVAAHGAEPAARLLLFLLQSEYSHAKILKDHLAYNVIKAVGQRKVMDPTIIESIIEETSRFHLAQSLWFDALVILKPGSTSRNYLFGVLSKSASRAVEDDEEG